MKKFIALCLTVSAVALAGDDYQTGLDITTSASSACVTVKPKLNYAIRCTQDTYVRNATTGKGDTATVKDPVAATNKLYDIPSTALQDRICALQVTTGGTCYVYLHREKGE